MSAIRLTATAGPDGVLHLDVPVGPAGTECEVVIVPKPAVNGTGRPPTPEDLGWPPGYFEQTFGSITDESFRRYPQPEPPPPVSFEDDE